MSEREKKTISRRDFLRITVLTAGAVALQSCAKSFNQKDNTPTSTPLKPSLTETPTITSSPTLSPTAEKTEVVNKEIFFTEDIRLLPRKNKLNKLFTPDEIIVHWSAQDGKPYEWRNDVTFNSLSEETKDLETGLIRTDDSHFGVDPHGITQFMQMYSLEVPFSYGARGCPEAIDIEMAGTFFEVKDGETNVTDTELQHTLDLIVALMKQYHLPFNKLLGHCEQDLKKKIEFDMENGQPVDICILGILTDPDGYPLRRGKPDPGRDFMNFLREKIINIFNAEKLDYGQPGFDNETVVNYPLDASNPNPGYAKAYKIEGKEGRIFCDHDEQHTISPNDLPSFGKERTPDAYLRTIKWFHVENSTRYIEDDWSYCNVFVSDVTRALGVEIPRYLNGKKTDANWIYKWLTGEGENESGWTAGRGSDYGWEEVVAEQAQFYADYGYPAVVTLAQDKAIGHVAMCVPGKMECYNMNYYPATAQAGSKNFVGQGAHYGFYRLMEYIKKQPRYFVNRQHYLLSHSNDKSGS